MLRFLIEDSAVSFQVLDGEDRSRHDVDIVSERKSIEFTGDQRSPVFVHRDLNMGKESHFGGRKPRKPIYKAAGSDTGFAKDNPRFKRKTSSPDDSLDLRRCQSKKSEMESGPLFKKRKTASPYLPSAEYALMTAKLVISKGIYQTATRAVTTCEHGRRKTRCKQAMQLHL